MRGKFFVDTNLWIYLYSSNTVLEKNKRVESIVNNYFEDIMISTQVLGEIYNVLLKKGLQDKQKAREIILDLSENFIVVDISVSAVLKAIELNIKYGYSYWDSLIVASALERGKGFRGVAGFITPFTVYNLIGDMLS